MRKAVEIAGGEEQLGDRLALSTGMIRLFLTGRIRLPQRLFLRLVDIISADSAPLEKSTARYWRGSRATD